MPAAAVIPAPIAYINVVAVKKLVVGFWACSAGRVARRVAGLFFLSSSSPFRGGWRGVGGGTPLGGLAFQKTVSSLRGGGGLLF